MNKVKIIEFSILPAAKVNRSGSCILGQFAALVGGFRMRGCGLGHGPSGYFTMPPRLGPGGHIQIMDPEVRTEMVERALLAYRALGGTFEPDDAPIIVEAPEGYVAANLNDDAPATLEDLAGVFRTLSVEQEEAYRVCG